MRRKPAHTRLAMLICAALLAAFSAATPAAAQTIIYVNASAAPGGNGQSWGTAYNDLEAALLQAAGVPEAIRNIEIWVAGGRYIPTRRRLPAEPRTASFVLLNKVRIIGGFAGTEAVLGERSHVNPPSVLSGDIADNDGPALTGTLRNDNCYHVVDANGVDASAVLDGLEISGGHANRVTLPTIGSGLYDFDSWGGGLTGLSGSGVHVRNCVFRANYASGEGGAIFSRGPGAPQIVNTRFLGNRADWWGGAISATGGEGAGNGLAMTIHGCEFSGNIIGPTRTTGDIGAAAILAYNIYGTGTSVTMTNCTFANNAIVNTNTSGNYGITLHTQAGAVTNARNCIFWDAAAGALCTYLNAPLNIRDSVLRGGIGSIVVNSSNGLTTANITTSDPLFVSPLGADGVAGTSDDQLGLNVGSPSIDQGVNSWIPPDEFLTIGGRLRVWDGNGDGVGIVDIGAYERASPLFHGPVLYVNSALAGGANTGASWADAFRGPLALQDALQFAATTLQGTYPQIWIARGTYKPAGFNGSRSATFQLPDNLAIYGGFVGNETTLGQRPPFPLNASDVSDPALATVLSGDLNSDDVAELNRSENALHVCSAISVSNVLLDGLTMRGGQANGASSVDQYGGGLFVSDASIWLRDCVLVDNFAFNGGGLGGRTNAIVHMTGSLVMRNWGATGAGIALSDQSQTIVRDTRFVENTAAAGQSGGGIAISASTASLIDSQFVRNRAGDGGTGGGVNAINASVLSLVNTQILGNTAATGGGVYGHASTLRIANSVFVGNHAAADSGAIAVVLGTGEVVNCTLVVNVATEEAGGLVLASAGGFVKNSLLWQNADSFAPREAANLIINGGSATAEANTIGLWSGIAGGADNNGDDPLFVRLPFAGSDSAWGTPDDDYGDLRLQAISPAIDSGNSASLPADTYDIDTDGNTTESLPLDLAGFPRFIDDPAAPNTGPGAAPHVDRGAYESQVNCLSCPGPREWRSPLGGQWDFPSNWTPSVPLSSHDTLFNLSASYTVTLPASQSLSVNSAAFSKGQVAFGLSGSTISLLAISSTSFEIGTLANTAASVGLTNGAINAVDARIGSVIGSTGSLSVGAGGVFSTSRSLTVGFQGAGSLGVSGGGRVFSRDATVGDQATSHGMVSVSGAGSRWDIPFFLIIDNGEVNVSSGGALTTGFGTYLFNQGKLTGDGVINGSVVNFGAIVPGNSPGTLTINGNYEQVGQIVGLGAAAGRIEAQVGGTTPGSFDKLVVNGTATLGGGMYVSLINGFQPAPTDAFALVSATQGLVRPFDVIFFPALPQPPTGTQKFLKANYSGLRGPGGGAVTIGVADLGINPDFNDPQGTTITGGPTAAAIGDLNNDGLPDLAISIPASTNPGSSPGSVIILFNRGGQGSSWQGFQQGAQQLAVGNNPMAVAIADLDGDERQDLIIANAGSDSVSFLRQNATVNGEFMPQQVQSVGVEPVSIAVGDFDRDLKIDLVVANRGGPNDTGSITTLRNITPGGGGGGAVGVETRTTLAPPQRKPRHVNPFNPDNDKDLDVAVALSDLTQTAGELAVYINGSGADGAPPSIFLTAGPQLRTTVGAAPVQSAAARFLPVGAGGQSTRQDVVTVSPSTNSVTVLVNTTAGTDTVSFAPPVEYVVSSGGAGNSAPISAALIDMDGDLLNDPDVAVLTRNAAGTNREIRILRNDSVPASGQNPAQIAFAELPAPLPAGSVSSPPFTVLVGNVDGDGRPDLVTVNAPGLRGNQSSVQVLRNALPPPALAIGSCCRGASCVLTQPAECVNAGQRFNGFGSTCNAPGNASTPCCKADANQNGQVTIDDIFIYLNLWFALSPHADTNASNSVTIDDIFVFLNAWFTGC